MMQYNIDRQIEIVKRMQRSFAYHHLRDFLDAVFWILMDYKQMKLREQETNLLAAELHRKIERLESAIQNLEKQLSTKSEEE